MDKENKYNAHVPQIALKPPSPKRQSPLWLRALCAVATVDAEVCEVSTCSQLLKTFILVWRLSAPPVFLFVTWRFSRASHAQRYQVPTSRYVQSVSSESSTLSLIQLRTRAALVWENHLQIHRNLLSVLLKMLAFLDLPMLESTPTDYDIRCVVWLFLADWALC